MINKDRPVDLLAQIRQKLADDKNRKARASSTNRVFLGLTSPLRVILIKGTSVLKTAMKETDGNDYL